MAYQVRGEISSSCSRKIKKKLNTFLHNTEATTGMFWTIVVLKFAVKILEGYLRRSSFLVNFSKDAYSFLAHFS